MQSKKIFIAPDAFVAFLDRTNPKHLQAGAYFRYFSQEQYFLYTNPLVLSDVYNEISEMISSVFAKEYMKTMSQSSINILYPEEADMKLAYKTLNESQDTSITFQEIIMASMAGRRDIPYICTVGYLRPLFGLTPFYLPI